MRVLLRAVISLIVLSVLSTDVRADVIYGTIRFRDDRATAGLKFSVVCGGQQYGGSVQSGGDYKVYVREQGVCTLRLFIESNSEGIAADVRSYDEPVRYNFVIVGGPFGYGLSRQ